MARAGSAFGVGMTIAGVGACAVYTVATRRWLLGSDATFSVVLVAAGIAALVGFAAASWRLGDALFRAPPLRRYSARVPAPLIALLGATLIYIAWQIPYLGAVAVVGALSYALGAVVTARLAHTTRSRSAT